MNKTQTMNEAFELQSKKRRNRRAAFRRALRWLKFILTIGIIITIVVFVALSPLFDIKRIDVNGSEHYTAEDIIAVSGLSDGENGFRLVGSNPLNIFTLSIGNAEKRLRQKCPYIKDVSVRFALTSVIRIEMTERKPYVSLPYMGTSLILDREGYILDAAPAGNKTKLPVVKGLKPDEKEPGCRISAKVPEAFSNVLEVLDLIKSSDTNESCKLYDITGEIDVSDPDNITVLLDSRLKVNLGDLEDLNYRVSFTRTVFSKSLKKEAKGMLDFTMGADPVFKPESGG